MASRERTLPLWRARPWLLRHPWFVLGSLTVFALVAAFGNAWDLDWHVMIGRDTFWIPPHTMMYAAIALSGMLVAGVVLSGILADPAAAGPPTLLGLRAPLGLVVLGLGVVQMSLSAPFDDWWHRMYGVDVTIWSPPHLIGFTGALVMLAGLTIAVLAQRRPESPREGPGPLAAAVSAIRPGPRAIFWLTALLLALSVRWLTFLNSAALQLSWAEEPDPYAIVGPWVGWWILWASFAMSWTFVASARCWEDRPSWKLPLSVLLLTLVLRLAEHFVSAAGFALALPWGDQVLTDPFPFFLADLGLWISTGVLILPAFAVAAIARWGRAWSPRSMGLAGGVAWGALLALQFALLRVVFDFAPFWSAGHAIALAVGLAAGVLGGLIGAAQGEWLRRPRH
jgi:hypothetical protein